MIITIDVEKAFNKIQCQFVLKKNTQMSKIRILSLPNKEKPEESTGNIIH